MDRTRKQEFSREGLNKGPWSPEEDKILCEYIKLHGEGKWGKIASKAGLNRCGRSCRLRWLNYLRPDIKRGNISHDEEDLILRLHKLLGNRWSLIAGRLPGRTDNEIKNYWNTVLRKKVEARSVPLKNHMSFNPDENKSFKVRTMAKAPLESKPTEVGKSPERHGIQTGIETSPVMGATALATEDYDRREDCLPNVVELEFIPHFGGELWQDVEMGSYCNNASFCQHFDDSVLLERGLYESITESDQIQPLFGPDLGSLSNFFRS